MTAYDVIIKPVMSEKSYAGVADKKYTFVVDMKANKIQIAQAIETIYKDVQVASVNTVIVRGKLKRQGKYAGYTSNYKKAIVTLKPNSKTISSFDSLT